jgi:uncharacterized delta-60 repeat protein
MWTVSSLLAPKYRTRPARRYGFRPRVEALEHRDCPALGPPISGGHFEWDDPTGGALDPTFGSGGQVINSFSNYNDAANAVTVQPDGKIVIAGSTTASGSKTGGDFLVARYTANGTPDASFGNSGYTATDFGTTHDGASAIALQPQADGTNKIVVAGLTQKGNDEFAVARYNPNGALDTTFGGKGSKGMVVTDLGGRITSAQSITVDAAGRILVAGFTNAPSSTTSGPEYAALVRYNPDGTLDTTFGKAGKLVTTIRVENDGHSIAVAVQADGKIVLGGDAYDPATNLVKFVVARFTTNGAADTGFGPGGLVTTQIGGYDALGGLAIQADGKIVIAGMQQGLDPDGVDRQGEYVLRYTPNGALDAGFGAAGVVYLVNPSGLLGQKATGVAVEADGQIVCGGLFEDGAGTHTSFAAMRVSPIGTLDVGFGDGGWATVQYTASAAVNAFALQPDGRVLLAGNARPTSNTYPVDVALVRFLTSAPQIGSFNANPNPVPSGSTATLTAANITDANPGATVAQVAFYIMIDGSGVLLGEGTQNSDGSWSYAFDTTGYAAGTYTLAAQATDSFGALGNPVALTLTIQ